MSDIDFEKYRKGKKPWEQGVTDPKGLAKAIADQALASMTPETPATPITEAGKALLAFHTTQPCLPEVDEFRDRILAIEEQAVAAWLASEGAVQRLAAQVESVMQNGHLFSGPGEAGYTRMARCILAALREGA